MAEIPGVPIPEGSHGHRKKLPDGSFAPLTAADIDKNHIVTGATPHEHTLRRDGTRDPRGILLAGHDYAPGAAPAASTTPQGEELPPVWTQPETGTTGATAIPNSPKDKIPDSPPPISKKDRGAWGCLVDSCLTCGGITALLAVVSIVAGCVTLELARQRIVGGGQPLPPTPRPRPTDIPGLNELYTVTPIATPSSHVLPAATPDPAPACQDGARLPIHVASKGGALGRTPVGEIGRSVIANISLRTGDKGDFGGFERFVVIVPKQGNEFQVNVSGAYSIEPTAFCGTIDQVTDWAIKHHVPGFMKASRDKEGNEPSADELAVYRVDYSGKFEVVKPAFDLDAPSADYVRSLFDLSQNSNGKKSSIPLKTAR